jgi:hypothetical protein
MDNDFDKMTVEELFMKMPAKEKDTLYFALLHLDEVGCLGDGYLRKLFDKTK